MAVAANARDEDHDERERDGGEDRDERELDDRHAFGGPPRDGRAGGQTGSHGCGTEGHDRDADDEEEVEGPERGSRVAAGGRPSRDHVTEYAASA